MYQSKYENNVPNLYKISRLTQVCTVVKTYNNFYKNVSNSGLPIVFILVSARSDLDDSSKLHPIYSN
jgi:hypothetical protein